MQPIMCSNPPLEDNLMSYTDQARPAANGKIAQSSIDELNGMLYEFITGPLGKKARGDGKTGEYTCSCPLPSHDGADKNPSFSLNGSDGTWYCHKEGQGGNTLDLAARTYGLTLKNDFRDVVERLARDLGVILEYEQSRPEDKKLAERKTQAYRVMAFSNDLYKRALDVTFNQAAQYKQEGIPHSKWDSEAAVFLDTDLGLTRETCEELTMGYAPTDPRFLYKKLSENGPDTLRSAVDAGLIKLTKANRDTIADPVFDNATTEQLNDPKIWRDTFINRVMYPIKDYKSGNVCGYTARTVEADPKGPKYINSNENVIYSKSSASALIGLHEAQYGHDSWRDKTGKLKAIALVEGPKDYARSASFGVPAICTNGIRISDPQIKAIMRTANEVIIGYDNDQAGRDAKIRVWESWLQHSDEVRVSQLVIPEDKKDPGDMNADDFKTGIRNRMGVAKTIASYVQEFSGYDQFIDSNDDKRIYAMELSERLLNAMPEGVFKADACTQIGKILNIDPKAMLNNTVDALEQRKREEIVPDTSPASPGMASF